MSAMSQAAVTFGSGWMLARHTGSLDSDSRRATRIAGPYVSMTTSTPSRSAFSNSRITLSASSRYLTGCPTTKSATSASCPAISAAYPAWRCAIPGIMSSYRSCMMPRIPIRGLRTVMTPPALLCDPWSSLAVLGGEPAVQDVDVLAADRCWLAEHPGQVHRPRGVLAHHGGLDGVAGGAADREDAVVAQQHGRRAVAGEGGHHGPADLLPADQRERRDRDLAAELVGDRGDHARDCLAARRPRRGIRRVRVHDAADGRHVPVDVRMRGRVARRAEVPVHPSAVQVAHHHRPRCQVGIADPARLDDHQVGAWHPRGYVA